MAITVINTAHGLDSWSVSTTIALNGVTEGSRIIVAFAILGVQTSVFRVSDNQNAGYYTEDKIDKTMNPAIGIFSIANTYTGNLTITIAGDTAAEIAGGAIEASGIAASSYVDKSALANHTSYGDSAKPGSVTTEDSDLIVAITAGAHHTALPSGYTQIDEDSGYVDTEYKIQISAGAENPTWTQDEASWWAAAQVAYKPVAGGGETNVLFMTFES